MIAVWRGTMFNTNVCIVCCVIYLFITVFDCDLLCVLTACEAKGKFPHCGQ